MRRKLLLPVGAVLLLLLVLPGQTSHATPTPPYVMVNETTKQCYISILGDECHWCDPPAGWTVLGNTQGGEHATSCPDGYTKIDHLELICKGYKQRYCCGGFSSHGDCEDLVKNATEQACGFVEDIHACVLPEGWYARPTDVSVWSWGCNPDKEKWVENVPCVTVTETPAALTLPAPEKSDMVLPAAGVGLIVVGGGALAWLFRKH